MIKTLSIFLSNYLNQSLVLFITIFLLSCDPKGVLVEEDYQVVQQVESKSRNLTRSGTSVVVIDSCEYLTFKQKFNEKQFGFVFLAHRGKCTNPVHNNNRISH